MAVHHWKPITPLRMSWKMLMLCRHGSYHRLQLISGNPPFRCGRLGKCQECVHIASFSQPYVVFVLGEPFIPLRAYHKLFGINVFSEIQTISVCSCDGVVAKGSHDLRMEMPPRAVDIFLPEMCWIELLCAHMMVLRH